MFAVWMFGRILEQVWGPETFLFYYILCGVGAGLLQEGVQYIQYVTELSQYTSVNIGTGIIPMSEYLNMMTTVGASGAVYAILLAFGMLFPNQQLFIFPLPFPIKAKFFVIGYALIELYAGFANNPGDNVAHFAHLGGMIFGFILIMYWRKRTETMGHIITDLKEAFRRGNVYIQLIFINVGVFVITTLIGILLQLFNRSAAGIFELLALPASFTRFAWQPWSIFTYMFMHAGFLHILFNMLWLYWFGALFLYFFSGKHLRGLYIVGGICGGLLYMISYNVFPYFRPMTAYSTMVGASASVLAIVVATAYREPNYPVRLLFFGNVRLKYLALIVVLTDLLFITSSNAGGHRPPGRSTGRTLVCGKPEQRERHHFMGQQGARCHRRPVQRQNLEAETQDEGALRKQYPSERLRLQRPQEGTIGRDRPDSRQAEEVGIRESDNRRKRACLTQSKR